MKSIKLAGALALAIIAAVAVAAALDPAAYALLAAAISDPHLQSGVAIANLAAVDPEMVKAELGKLSERMSNWMEKRTEKEKEVLARLLDVEQKAARRGSGGDPGAPYDGGGAALRDLLEASSELKGMAAEKVRRAVVDLPPGYFKAAITTGPGMGFPEQRPDIVAMPKRRLTVRGLLPSVPTTAGSIQYLRETAFTNNAATVSETTEKPESSITFELKTTSVAVIAHWIKTSKIVLDDTAQLQQHIDGRLRYGVAMAEENQLLKGSGVGNNLQGLSTAATAFSGSTAGSKVDVLRRAITQLSDSELEATGIVLHPHDWEAIELIKDTTGRYIVGNPGGPGLPTLWNLPVVPTNAMTAGDFLVADFPQAALVFDREQARVNISTETGTDFIENMVRLRGEERIGLAIFRTLALIRGQF